MAYVEVVFPIALDQTFTYKLPEVHSLSIQAGDIINCPFRNGEKAGCVIRRIEKLVPLPKYEIKSVLHKIVCDYRISEDLLQLSRWMNQYYCQPQGVLLEHMAMTGFRPKVYRKRKYVVFHSDVEEMKLPYFFEAIEHLKKNRILPESVFYSYAGNTKKRAAAFFESGALELREFPFFFKNNDLLSAISPAPEPCFHTLNTAQQHCVDSVAPFVGGNKYKAFLLHGITGSGKTEVFARLIQKALEKGLDVIYLVPEVSLVDQAVSYLRDRFGDCVQWYHYLRSNSEKQYIYEQVMKKQVRIMVGARSAVFAPLKNPGLIIVDEEHAGSYKADDTVIYNARDVAVYRGYLHKIPVVLGSATPSLESYYNALHGKYQLLEMNERYNKTPLPEINVVDLREHVHEYEPDLYLSKPLYQMINETLAKNLQVLLFLNRRGFSHYQTCMSCGHIIRCDMCNVALTYHKKERRLKCHYCDYFRRPLTKCPACSAKKMSFVGSGTQKLEEGYQKVFPDRSIVRFDSDSASTQAQLNKIFDMIHKKNVDITLGTQMVTKGLDIERLNMVGILDIDSQLNLPDFRASEKAFQVLVQAAGRAGRRDVQGKVILQTFTRDHYVIQAFKESDYAQFYQREMKIRASAKFPPVIRLSMIRISDNRSLRAKSCADEIAYLLKDFQYDGLSILGPSVCPIERINGRFRFMIILRYQDWKQVHSGITEILAKVKKDKRFYSCRMKFDVDASNFL